MSRTQRLCIACRLTDDRYGSRTQWRGGSDRQASPPAIRVHDPFKANGRPPFGFIPLGTQFHALMISNGRIMVASRNRGIGHPLPSPSALSEAHQQHSFTASTQPVHERHRVCTPSIIIQDATLPQVGSFVLSSTSINWASVVGVKLPKLSIPPARTCRSPWHSECPAFPST
jgi:hypothetical protein